MRVMMSRINAEDLRMNFHPANEQHSIAKHSVTWAAPVFRSPKFIEVIYDLRTANILLLS